MSRRTWQWVGLAGVATVLAIVASTVPAVSASPAAAPASVPKADPDVRKFVQPWSANLGNPMLKVGHQIFFELRNEENGATWIARISPKGKVRLAPKVKSLTPLTRLLRSSDGGVWAIAGKPGLGTGASIIGLDRGAWKQHAYSSQQGNPRGGWNPIVDGDDRYWAQIDTGKRLGLFSAGFGKKPAFVKTKVKAVSSTLDDYVTNQLIIGPDGRGWVSGPSALGTGRLRVTSATPNDIKVDVTMPTLRIGPLALNQGGGKVWAIGATRGARLVAVGVDPGGDLTRVPTELFAECLLDVVRPVTDGAGGLWFTGTADPCQVDSPLYVTRVLMNRGIPTHHDTGLVSLHEVVSTLAKVDGGVLVAGFNADNGDLGFSRVVDGSATVIPTTLQPWTMDGQLRFQVESDQRDGAWAQAVNSKANLVVVHVRGDSADQIPTGLKPHARELKIGPDKSLWTHGLHNGNMVIVKVAQDGTVTKYRTGLEPPDIAVKPVYDGRKYMWFQASNQRDQLVMVRVPARG